MRSVGDHKVDGDMKLGVGDRAIVLYIRYPKVWFYSVLL